MEKVQESIYREHYFGFGGIKDNYDRLENFTPIDIETAKIVLWDEPKHILDLYEIYTKNNDNHRECFDKIRDYFDKNYYTIMEYECDEGVQSCLSGSEIPEFYISSFLINGAKKLLETRLIKIDDKSSQEEIDNYLNKNYDFLEKEINADYIDSNFFSRQKWKILYEMAHNTLDVSMFRNHKGEDGKIRKMALKAFERIDKDLEKISNSYDEYIKQGVKVYDNCFFDDLNVYTTKFGHERLEFMVDKDPIMQELIKDKKALLFDSYGYGKETIDLYKIIRNYADQPELKEKIINSFLNEQLMTNEKAINTQEPLASLRKQEHFDYIISLNNQEHKKLEPKIVELAFMSFIFQNYGNETQLESIEKELDELCNIEKNTNKPKNKQR